jgi:hypothetical protein
LKFWLQGILFVSFGLIFIQANAQTLPEVKDSIQKAIEKPVKIHSPGKATMYSAVLPGLGQIYNKKYYKVPIIYGGFVGLGYLINHYNQRYYNFKQAYYDLTDQNPLTKSYETTYPYYDYSKTSAYQTYSESFIPEIDRTRRKRDLFIIATVGFYLLNVLDANVDAHFIDFDISEDLTFNFEPIMVDPITNSTILGGHLVLNF